MSVKVISGIGDAGISFAAGKNALELRAEASLAAITDAGLSVSDIDGVCVTKSADLAPGDRPASQLAEYLGIEAAFIDTTLAGGTSPLLHLMHAVDAISSGRCKRVLVAYGSTQRSSQSRTLKGLTREDDPARQLEMMGRLPMPVGIAALVATAYLAESNRSRADLAAVPVTHRQWARLNDQALSRKPLSVEDVLSEELISTPLGRKDLCLVTDGAAAFVVEGADRGLERSVSILGFGEQHTHYSLSGLKSLTTTGAELAAGRAFDMADLRPRDVGSLGLYDAFSILPPILLEDIGFADKGQGLDLYLDGHCSPGGSLPTNTQGGGLSHCHPGIYGAFLLLEGVRQMREEASGRQVPIDKPFLAHATGGGSFGGAHGTVILGRRGQ